METAISVHTFNVNMKWDPETGTGMGRSGNRMPLVFGPPPEFGGTEFTWSPEHLLAAAVSSCYTNTFLHFARLLKLSVTVFRIAAHVDFEKGKAGFEATRFVLRPVIAFHHIPSQTVLDDLFAKAKKYCFVSNSVKGSITVEPHVLQG